MGSTMFSLALVLLGLLVASSGAERTRKVRCESTAGPWTAEVHPSWSPNGAKRYLELVADGFFDNMPLFRAVPGFLVQFGISVNASMNQKWDPVILDDPFPFHVEMKKGIMAYAGNGKNSRNTQVWIGYEGASGLGHSPWETPFAEILDGMESVERIYSGYGDQVDQGRLQNEGEAYIRSEFPKLDFINRCFIMREHPHDSKIHQHAPPGFNINALTSQDIVTVTCDSTEGEWKAEIHPGWSPLGVKRYLELVEDGFYDNSPLFRAIPGFLVQFGISLNSSANAKWHRNIEDDPFPAYVHMRKGIMAFAGYGKNSRSTQVWIGYEGASGLGHSPWETPIGEIVSGMGAVESIYGGYGGDVEQGRLRNEGEKYLKDNFPKLSYIYNCVITGINKPNVTELVLDFNEASNATT